jgi:large subunit ribosomal protein L25
MLNENLVLEVERRPQTGKNASNRYRDRDLIPAVIYGGGAALEPMSLVVGRKALITIINRKAQENSIFKLRLKGTDQERYAMIRDMSIHPVSRRIQHVDFIRILLDRKMKLRVRIEVVGIPKGVKVDGGFLNVVTHQLMIECMPGDIPESIAIDVAEMGIHDSLRVSDLKLGEKVKVLENAERVIAHVGVSKGEEAAVAVVAPVAATGSEPEVIKKGKKEEEAKTPEKKEKK